MFLGLFPDLSDLSLINFFSIFVLVNPSLRPLVTIIVEQQAIVQVFDTGSTCDHIPNGF